MPLSIYGARKEIKEAYNAFYSLGNIRYFHCLKELSNRIGSQLLTAILQEDLVAYTILRLGRYAIVNDLKNLMVDDPAKALNLFNACQHFMVNPVSNVRANLSNLTLEEVRESRNLPVIYQPEKRVSNILSSSNFGNFVHTIKPCIQSLFKPFTTAAPLLSPVIRATSLAHFGLPSPNAANTQF